MIFVVCVTSVNFPQINMSHFDSDVGILNDMLKSETYSTLTGVCNLQRKPSKGIMKDIPLSHGGEM